MVVKRPLPEGFQIEFLGMLQVGQEIFLQAQGRILIIDKGVHLKIKTEATLIHIGRADGGDDAVNGQATILLEFLYAFEHFPVGECCTVLFGNIIRKLIVSFYTAPELVKQKI